MNWLKTAWRQSDHVRPEIISSSQDDEIPGRAKGMRGCSHALRRAGATPDRRAENQCLIRRTWSKQSAPSYRKIHDADGRPLRVIHPPSCNVFAQYNRITNDDLSVILGAGHDDIEHRVAQDRDRQTRYHAKLEQQARKGFVAGRFSIADP